MTGPVIRRRSGRTEAPPGPAHLLKVMERVTFDDEHLWRLRQELVAETRSDEVTIEANVGLLATMRVAFFSGRFSFDAPAAELRPAFIAGALDHLEKIIDFVAWPVGRPADIATYAGNAVLLGLPFLAASRSRGEPMPIFRTAAAWLKAGGRGLVPLGRGGAYTMLDIDSPLLAEDDQHGAELDEARWQLLRQAPPIMVEDQIGHTA